MPELVDPHHLLLIGAGPGVGAGVVRLFDPDSIAELFWTAHTDSKDAWQTEYRFTGA